MQIFNYFLQIKKIRANLYKNLLDLREYQFNLILFQNRAVIRKVCGFYTKNLDY